MDRKSSLPKQLSDHIDRVLFLLSNHIKLLFLVHEDLLPHSIDTFSPRKTHL